MIPEPRGLGENGWRHDDLYSRISINSKFGVFWPLSTRLPGTPLNLPEVIGMTHYLTLESIWLISLSLFPYMHKYDSSFIISPMDMAILHAKLVWLSVATITTSFSIWLRLSIETLNQYSQNESWLRLSIETLNHPPKTTIVPSPSLFVTVTNEDRDWPV